MKITALIPVYNEADSLPIIIDKVLKVSEISQIIVVDDCSTDGTRDWLKSYSHPRVKLIFHEKNQGKTGAINTAIEATEMVRKN